MADVIITDNPEASRYEADLEGRAAGFAEYRRSGDTVVMPHTEVFDDFGGQGVGTALVRHALDDLRERGLRVIPTCPFVASFIDKHPEYRELVTEQA